MFLFLAKTKTKLLGYRSPKPFSVSDKKKCFDYDISVVNEWIVFLQRYGIKSEYIVGKNVLELGPGSDLGVGIYLLHNGVSKYNAIDSNWLIKKVPDSFYEFFLSSLLVQDSSADVAFLRNQIKDFKNGKDSKLNYKVNDAFDIAGTFGQATIDIVFSQAAFEHFDDIEKTIQQLSVVCKPGAILIALVDLQTHSRWIRKKDPNNIYRYHKSIYNLFWFRGAPNRKRPYEYKEAFERADWENVKIFPLAIKKNSAQLWHGFAHTRNQMDYLSIMICASKKVPIRTKN
jgi:SAM-dependent methyltransferase